MSTIIKKQYETAKELLKSVEQCYENYELFNCVQNWANFLDMSTRFMTIIGNVKVIGAVVLQEKTDAMVSIIDNCRQKFAAYEAELKALGLIDNKPKMKNEDLYSMQKIERMQDEEDQINFEKHYYFNR